MAFKDVLIDMTRKYCALVSDFSYILKTDGVCVKNPRKSKGIEFQFMMDDVQLIKI